MPAPYPSCYLNGSYLPLQDARVSPLDRGFLFADGVYEVVPVLMGRAFRLREHLARLSRSCAAIGLADPHSASHWAAVVQHLAAQGGGADALVYLQVTRGAEFGRNHLFPAQVAPTVFGFANPYPQPATATLTHGLAAVCLADTRWARCDIKSIALLANVLLRQQAHESGADEAVLTRDGRVLEGSSSSVFVVRGGRAATPPDSHEILPGTTRDAMLELASGLMPTEQREIGLAELRSADEVWIASAGRGVLPVTRIDGTPVGDGRPGPAWRLMYDRWQAHLTEIAPAPAL